MCHTQFNPNQIESQVVTFVTVSNCFDICKLEHLISESDLNVNEIYMQWYRLHLEAGKEEETDISRNFADFFECVQVCCKKYLCNVRKLKIICLLQTPNINIIEYIVSMFID